MANKSHATKGIRLAGSALERVHGGEGEDYSDYGGGFDTSTSSDSSYGAEFPSGETSGGGGGGDSVDNYAGFGSGFDTPSAATSNENNYGAEFPSGETSGGGGGGDSVDNYAGFGSGFDTPSAATSNENNYGAEFPTGETSGGGGGGDSVDNYAGFGSGFDTPSAATSNENNYGAEFPSGEVDGGLVGSNTTAGRAEWGGVPDAGQGAEVLGNAAPHQGDWFTTAETLGQANASGSGAPADMADWSLPNGSAAGNDPSATFNPFLKTPIAEQPAPLFRGERPSMGPETVFNDGLVPKGTNNDLFAHVSNNGAGSSFVSTSSSMDVARDFALSNGERASGWIYRINGQGAIDAAAATNNFRYTADQQEHVFRGPVEMSRVEAVAPVTREGGIGEFAPNPGFEAPSTLPATAANAARATAGGAAAGAAFAAADLALERAAAANFPGAQMAQHALRSDLAQTAAAIAFPASTIASGLSQQALDSMWPSTPGSWQDSAKRIVSGAAGGIGTVADSAAGFWTRPFTTGPAVSMVAPSGAAARANAAANGNESLALGAP